MDTIPVSRERMLDQLERRLASPTFAGAGRSRVVAFNGQGWRVHPRCPARAFHRSKATP